jgi:hypothetical protein
MDRSMKVMFGMMTIAICLLAITMMNNQSQQAYAGEYVGGGDRGTEPTIVSFRVNEVTKEEFTSDNSSTNVTVYIVLTRMWSDGTVEMNVVGSETLPNPSLTELTDADSIFTGWRTVKDSPPVNIACTGDTDSNGDVNTTDLLALIGNWGACEEEPMNLPPDPDLM